MATAGGTEAATPEQATTDRVCSLLAPDAGAVLKKSTKTGKWKPVFLLARVDLWWIDMKGSQTCPQDTGAWHKGHSIGLVRDKTKVHHTDGEREWVVEYKEQHKEFKADSLESASLWVANLQHRVCSWHELLGQHGEQSHSRLGRVRERDALSGPLFTAHLETAQELVGVLKVTAELAKELGSVPVAGPALSLLGFALEVMRRKQADTESLRPARDRLLQITKRTIEAAQTALKRKDQDYVQSLVELLVEIEGGARDLEKYENKSKVLRFGDATINRKTGPAGILKLVEQCEEHLSKLQIDHTAKEVDKLSKLVEGVAEGVAGVEAVLSDQQKTSRCAIRKESCLATIPISPDAVALQQPISIVKEMLFCNDNDSKYIAILGMGGIGKTTLARAIINDEDIKSRFPIRGFVVVAREPDIVQCHEKIWKAVVNSQDKIPFATAADGEMQLQAALKDKCVFLVVDDVWDKEDMMHLDVVSGNSRVVITSRNEEVAYYVQAKCHIVTGLDDAQSKNLFCKHAFNGQKPLQWQERYVEEIVQECAGVP